MPNTHKCAACKGTGMIGAASCETCKGTGSVKVFEPQGLEAAVAEAAEQVEPRAVKVRSLKLSSAGRKSNKGLSFSKR